MGALIQIAIYAAIAGAAWFAIHQFDLSRQNIGAARQLAADKPIIEACKIDRDTAVKANVSLQADVERIAGERDRQNAAVKALGDAAIAQDKARIARQAAAKPRIDALRADSLTLEQRLAANTEGKTCDEKLSNVDRDLRALVGGGVRDVGAATPSRDGSKDATPRPGSGGGTLRLSQ